MKDTSNHKIFAYIDDAISYYENEKVERIEGLSENQAEIIKTIEYYTSAKYLTGNKDGLGREKPFLEINNFRVRVAKTSTDIDLKDIRCEADRQKDYAASLLLNNELMKWFKESNFSKTLNDMGATRPKYGGLLVKKTEVDGKLNIEVVDWKNVYTDQVDILSSVIELHYLSPSEFSARSDAWENVDEVLKAFTKHHKGKCAGKKIEVFEVFSEFPAEYNEEYEEGDTSYKPMKFFVAQVGKEKFYLDSYVEKDKAYMYLEWEKVAGRGLGRGIVEEGFEAQIWTNDAVIAQKDAMELAGKVLLWTNSKKVGDNILSGVDNGHVFELDQNDTINSLNLIPSALPEFQNMITMWKDQFDRTASTFDANTGEAPTSGTPYSQTALLNQVANSPFEYQREVWGIFLNEIIREWILPHLVKKIKKSHTLVSDFSEEELTVIDESFAVFSANKEYIKKMLSGGHVYMEEYLQAMQAYKELQGVLGKKRYIEIPDGFFDDVGVRITINITGEQRNKQAILASLNSLLLAYNPQMTGDPVYMKLLEMIVEISGVPLSPLQLRAPKTPTAQPQQMPSQPAPQLPQQPNPVM